MRVEYFVALTVVVHFAVWRWWHSFVSCSPATIARIVKRGSDVDTPSDGQLVTTTRTASMVATDLSFASLVSRGITDCATAFACPCCGACISQWASSGRGRKRLSNCPVCRTSERHRSVCYAFATTPPAALAASGRRRYPKTPLVAYFGPQAQHAKALAKSTRPRPELLEFDYFAPGYLIPGQRQWFSRQTIHADIQHIPLQGSALDGLVILHVLEHVANLTKAVDEMARVLVPGGFVEHETPCMAKPPGATPSSVKCVREATTGRLDTSAVPVHARGICGQPNHEWAHACWHLRGTFERAGFVCEPTPAGLTLAHAERFNIIPSGAVSAGAQSAGDAAHQGRHRDAAEARGLESEEEPPFPAVSGGWRGRFRCIRTT